MNSTTSRVRTELSSSEPTPFTLASTFQHLRSMSLTQFRQQFTGIYRALQQFRATIPDATRGQLTIGATLADNAAISEVSNPEYRVLTDDNVETSQPDDFETYDLYLSFWTDEFNSHVKKFKQSVVTEVLRTLVISERRADVLPVEERADYETMLHNRRSDDNC